MEVYTSLRIEYTEPEPHRVKLSTGVFFYDHAMPPSEGTGMRNHTPIMEMGCAQPKQQKALRPTMCI